MLYNLYFSIFEKIGLDAFLGGIPGTHSINMRLFPGRPLLLSRKSFGEKKKKIFFKQTWLHPENFQQIQKTAKRISIPLGYEFSPLCYSQGHFVKYC